MAIYYYIDLLITTLVTIMRSIAISVTLLVFGLFQFQGCSRECASKPGADEYQKLAKSISSSSSNTDAIREFSTLSVNDQITVFLYARGCPGDPRIRPYLILDGERKIPVIVERIRTEEKLWDKAELISVLIPINTKCKCIAKDSEVVRTLEDVGKRLDENKSIPPDETYRQTYHDSLNVLKGQLESK